MQEIRLAEPTPEEVLMPAEPGGTLWHPLTPERAKELWRLTRSFLRLFDSNGEWFSGSRDRPEYLAAFRTRVLAEVGPPERPVYVLHGQEGGAFTTVGAFLDRWPALSLEGPTGYDVLPLDLSLWLEVHYSGAARVARRAG